MTLQPCTVDVALSVDDAGDRMSANNIRHLLVLQDTRLVGVLSSRDIAFARGLLGPKAKQSSIADAMSTSVYTCSVDAPLQDVAAEMEGHRYGCAVILDDDFVVGIFTTTDAMRAIRVLVTGEKVEARTAPTHLVDLTAERKHVEHTVRLGDRLRPQASDGLIGTIGL